jgi:hypothetical protein
MACYSDRVGCGGGREVLCAVGGTDIGRATADGTVRIQSIPRSKHTAPLL